MARNAEPNMLAIIGLGHRPAGGTDTPSVTAFDRDFFADLSGAVDDRRLLLLETAWTAWEDAGLVWAGAAASGDVAQHLEGLLHGPSARPGNAVPAAALWAACDRPTGTVPEVELIGGAADSEGAQQPPGCVVLVLKELRRAVDDGDRIHCTVRTRPPEPSDEPATACGDDLAEVARAVADLGAGVRSEVLLSVAGRPERVVLEPAHAFTDPSVASVASGPSVSLPSAPAAASDSSAVFPVVLSARSEQAMRAQARQLGRHMSEHPALDAVDVAHTLATRRTAWEHRAVAMADGRARMAEALEAIARGDGSGAEGSAIVRGTVAEECEVVFVFPGHGPQWAGMGRELLAADPVFRDEMLRCEEAFEPYLDFSVTDVVTGKLPLDRLDMAQPALFSVMVALAATWRAHGITPTAVLGHSFGETAAATVSGVLSLDEGARLVAAYGRAQMKIHGKGDLLAVALPPEDVTARLGRWAGRLELAVVNGPRSSVVSGDPDAVRELLSDLVSEGVRTRLIPFGVAAHSHQVEEVRESLVEELAGIVPKDSAVPFYASTMGERVDPRTLDAQYWYRNLRTTSRFDRATQAALQDDLTLFLEVGPHPVLTMSIEEAAADRTGIRVADTLRRGDGGRDRFLQSLAQLHVHGARPDWNSLFGQAGGTPRRADLPPYPFQRETAASGGPSGPDSPFARDLLRMPVRERRATLMDLVYETVAELTDEDTGGSAEYRDFRSLGFDSLRALNLRNTLNQRTGLRLSATAAFDFPTPQALADHMYAQLTGESLHGEPDTSYAPTGDPDEPIAIVGIGCRLPGGVSSPEELWQLVSDEVSTVGPYPTDRGWDLQGLYNEDPSVSGTFYQREVSFLADAAGFDAGFFGISPREALAMDPQQRLVLETSWEALERAGIDPHSLRGSDTSVFIGAAQLPYGPQLQDTPPEVEGYALTGTTSSVTSGRVAYSIGLEGPAVTVDTACSSSLVALHLACRSLRSSESALSLAGGVTVHALPGLLTEFSRQRGLSEDGRCKSFSDDADGFGMAEGAGVLVLERLSDARRLGHRVLAVIRGSAVN
ncbi:MULTISPECIES: beta-ketoacyl synthase N-terminal-like domain-containing protein, partial [unclassified Streptomyces]|uniref:beta-ketoacyl synthase N-terminal-like domain-containing protein n=1 Tax=unclassified Streptomyces TaxID=2593676 RepID=UPI003791572B